MVNFGMSVQASPGHGVWGIDEKGHVLPVCIPANEPNPVALRESNALPILENRQDAPFQSFRIPPGSQTAPVLAALEQASSSGHDTATLDSVPQNRLERTLKLIPGCLGQNGSYCVVRQLEGNNFGGQALALDTQNRLPDCSNILVDLNEGKLLSKALKKHRETDYCTPGEGLDKLERRAS
jgi:hypothetical protein